MRLSAFRRVPILVAALLLLVPALAAAQDDGAELTNAVNTLWVVLAAVLVLFMQAGFAMLETGLSRMKNAGAIMAKTLVNLSIALVMFWAFGFAIAFGDGNSLIGSSGWFLEGEIAEHLRRLRRLRRPARGALPVPGGVRRGLAGDRLRRDARPHQVRRLRDLRGVLRRPDLPVRGPLDLGRRLAVRGRLPRLRRLVHRPPAGRARGARRGADPGPAHRQVPQRQGDPDPGSLDAAGRPRRVHPVRRLGRLQRRLGPRAPSASTSATSS